MVSPPYVDVLNRWRTRSLFLEEREDDVDLEPVFSFQDRPIPVKPGLIPMKDTFMAFKDTSGYAWAMEYLKSWEHYNVLLKKSWFRERIDKWIEEMHLSERNSALATIREIAKGENPVQALAASKYLAERAWEKPSRGRPSKEEIKGELKKAVKALDEEEADLARMQSAPFTVVQGGKAG